MGGTRAVGTAVGGVALLVGGLAIGLAFHSPAERVTVPVPDQLLTATVEEASLSQELTGQGTFTAPTTEALSVAPPSGMDAVVTATPYAAGQTTSWCTVLIEVSGRPVILLPGDVPAYRDLTVGDTGDDVLRLQQALRACGLHVATDGVFGSRTAEALRSLYRGLGQSAVTATAEALGGSSASTSIRPTASGGAPQSSEGNGAASEGASPPSAVAASGDGSTASLIVTEGGVDDAAAAAGGAQPGDQAAPPPTAPAPGAAASVPPAVVAPRGELLFTRVAPRVLSIAATGDRPGEAPVATLATAGDQFSLALTAAQRAVVDGPVAATITYGTWSAEVTLPAPPATPTVDDSGTPTYPVGVPLPGPAPQGSYGQRGDYRITVSSPTTYDAVVPVSAVYEDTAGVRYVLTPATPEPRRLDVEVLAAVGGMVAVRGLHDDLDAGDEVVIGVR